MFHVGHGAMWTLLRLLIYFRCCCKKLLLMGVFPVSKHELDIFKSAHGTIHISLDL